MCPSLKEVILVSVKSSIESWNKSPVRGMQDVWFSIEGKVGPRYLDLILKVGVSSGLSRAHVQSTQRLVSSVLSEYLRGPKLELSIEPLANE